MVYEKFKIKEEIKIIDTIDKSDWLKVFSATLGKMMAIQQNASEYVVKGRNWNVDFSKGIIMFGDDVYPVQFIGSESSTSNTWMWGWNNVNHFPDSLIELANNTLKKGHDWSLDPLRVDQFELNDIFNGHNLSIVACGISEKPYFYYRGPHSGGAVFMAVDAPKEVLKPVNIQIFANITMQCLQQYPIDHKIFVESFLQWNKTSYEWNNKILVAHFTQDLYFTFDQVENHYRLTEINTK